MTWCQLCSFPLIHSFIYLSDRHLLNIADAVKHHVWWWGEHTWGVWADGKIRSPVGRIGRLPPNPQNKGRSSEGEWTPKASSLSTDTITDSTVEVGMKDSITTRQWESSVYRKLVISDCFYTHRHAHLQKATPALPSTFGISQSYVWFPDLLVSCVTLFNLVTLSGQLLALELLWRLNKSM